MQGCDPFRQHGPHVERIEEPDQAEYAEADGDVYEDFANIRFLFLVFAVECRGLVIFPERWSCFTRYPLSLPAHSTHGKLHKERNCKIRTAKVLNNYVKKQFCIYTIKTNEGGKRDRIIAIVLATIFSSICLHYIY